MDNPNKVTREFSMKINVKKTKVMCISLRETIYWKFMLMDNKWANLDI